MVGEMIEKRFDYTHYDDGTESIYDRKKDEYYWDMQLSQIEELLNELNDENEQLKKEKDYYKGELQKELVCQAIIDRRESMTENKRFIVDDCGTVIDMQTRDTFDYVSEVVDLLNEQHEEIIELKEAMKRLMGDLMSR